MQTEMQITLNDQLLMFKSGLSLADILQQQGVDQGCFVTVVNDAVVPKTTLDQHLIYDGDRIEILSPISGG